MSGELIAIVAVGVTLAGLILTSSRGCGRKRNGAAGLSLAFSPPCRQPCGPSSRWVLSCCWRCF